MLTSCLELLSAFSGIERENINRGSGWLFLSIGRRLERSMYLTRQLREITRGLPTDDWSYLQYLLDAADSSMTYRARYYTTLHPLAVLDVLMADGTNPRSLDFQLFQLADLYERLPHHDAGEAASMREALASLRAFDLQAIQYPADAGPGRKDKGLVQLDRYLARLESLLPSWSNNMSSQYFSLVRTLPVTMGE